MTELVHVDNLGALFTTRGGQTKRKRMPKKDQILWTVIEQGQLEGDPTRVAYLAHRGGRGGRNPGHDYEWQGTSLHTLVSEDPLTLDPSIGWQECCGRHGFIKNGKWEPTGDSIEP